MELKDIAINTAYSINDNGSIIISKLTGHLLKSSIQRIRGKDTGYLYATLCIGLNDSGEFTTVLPKRIAVHRLVAFTWIGEQPTPEHKWVNHKDGNKANNHHENLEWTTISENIQHAFDTGLKVAKKGSESPLYGRKHNISTRNKMSQKKLGVNHPKFKGYYFVNFKRYESANQAAKETGLIGKTIISRCNNPKFKLKGYYFVPVEKQTF